jgi:protein subunit release factor B
MLNAHFPTDEDTARRLAVLGVKPEECVERFVLGGGPGGQKINKTASTVVVRHEPTGVEVRVQRERSQARNRALAWSELARRLEERRTGQAAAARDLRERERRRRRQKSRGQKAAMVREKKHRARVKEGRKRAGDADG